MHSCHKPLMVHSFRHDLKIETILLQPPFFEVGFSSWAGFALRLSSIIASQKIQSGNTIQRGIKMLCQRNEKDFFSMTLLNNIGKKINKKMPAITVYIKRKLEKVEPDENVSHICQQRIKDR